MLKVRQIDDLEEGQAIWEFVWPKECLFDLWPVRACFAEAFARPNCFLVAENQATILGVLPLSWIDEAQSFGYFPGETWQGKTWLEQNKIPAATPRVCEELLAALPGPTLLRYLNRTALPASEALRPVDETGYLFLPRRYNFSFERYRLEFSSKSRKKYNREAAGLLAAGISYRHNQLADVEELFRLNLEAFGARSYFHDPRFLRAFENLVTWLHRHDLLRITTVLLGGRLAAVDLGAIWGRQYTVLAGGAHAEFAGVAKLINFHHLEWACRQNLDVVDFLCGDFGWKERFHLTPRPLYKIQTDRADFLSLPTPAVRSMVCAL